MLDKSCFTACARHKVKWNVKGFNACEVSWCSVFSPKEVAVSCGFCTKINKLQRWSWMKRVVGNRFVWLWLLTLSGLHETEMYKIDDCKYLEFHFDDVQGTWLENTALEWYSPEWGSSGSTQRMRVWRKVSIGSTISTFKEGPVDSRIASSVALMLKHTAKRVQWWWTELIWRYLPEGELL